MNISHKVTKKSTIHHSNQHVVLVLQVSFRYHCQLYSEWRRTNQKVRLLIPDTKGAHSTQHSLLSTKLLKKTADETIV